MKFFYNPVIGPKYKSAMGFGVEITKEQHSITFISVLTNQGLIPILENARYWMQFGITDKEIRCLQFFSRNGGRSLDLRKKCKYDNCARMIKIIWLQKEVIANQPTK